MSAPPRRKPLPVGDAPVIMVRAPVVNWKARAVKLESALREIERSHHVSPLRGAMLRTCLCGVCEIARAALVRQGEEGGTDG